MLRKWPEEYDKRKDFRVTTLIAYRKSYSDHDRFSKHVYSLGVNKFETLNVNLNMSSYVISVFSRGGNFDRIPRGCKI